MPTKCMPHNNAHPGPLGWSIDKTVIWCCPDAWNNYYQLEVAEEMKQKRLKALKQLAS
jgi:hypothetical protein